jgi:hypothetical protein
LTRVAQVAADDRCVAGSQADSGGKTLDIAGMHDGFAVPDNEVATTRVPIAGKDEHFAKPNEHVADATDAFAADHDGCPDRASAGKRPSTDRAAIGTLDAFPHSRPAVGREACRSGQLDVPSGARPPRGMQEDWRTV